MHIHVITFNNNNNFNSWHFIKKDHTDTNWDAFFIISIHNKIIINEKEYWKLNLIYETIV